LILDMLDSLLLNQRHIINDISTRILIFMMAIKTIALNASAWH